MFYTEICFTKCVIRKDSFYSHINHSDSLSFSTCCTAEYGEEADPALLGDHDQSRPNLSGSLKLQDWTLISFTSISKTWKVIPLPKINQQLKKHVYCCNVLMKFQLIYLTILLQHTIVLGGITSYNIF